MKAFSWTLALFFPAVLFAAESSVELDPLLMKERLKKIYGDFIVKPSGDWQVSYDGKMNLWKWNGKAWTCPVDTTVKCSDWIPTSFQWWGGRGFWDNWSLVARAGFEFGKAKNQMSPINAAQTEEGAEGSAVDLAGHPVEKVEARDPLGDKKWALEVWNLKNKSGTEAKIYISLRDQKIERIDLGDAVEYLEWRDKKNQTGQEILRIVLEKQGSRLVFSKLK